MSITYTKQELEQLYENISEFNKASLEKEKEMIVETQYMDVDELIQMYRDGKPPLDSKYHKLHFQFLFGGIISFENPSMQSTSYLHFNSLQLINQLSSKYLDWIRAESDLSDALKKIAELQTKLQEYE